MTKRSVEYGNWLCSGRLDGLFIFLDELNSAKSIQITKPPSSQPVTNPLLVAWLLLHFHLFLIRKILLEGLSDFCWSNDLKTPGFTKVSPGFSMVFPKVFWGFCWGF